MRITYVHASRHGNGARVADRFRAHALSRGATVEVLHVRRADPTDLPAADLYVFSSPGRIGRPLARMRRFIRLLRLPPGTPYAVVTTEAMPPADGSVNPRQRVRPEMHELLDGAGLVDRGELCVHVADIAGPLEDGWTTAVDRFTDDLLSGLAAPCGPR